MVSIIIGLPFSLSQCSIPLGRAVIPIRRRNYTPVLYTNITSLYTRTADVYNRLLYTCRRAVEIGPRVETLAALLTRREKSRDSCDARFTLRILRYYTICITVF